jgi:hypothetical protein
MKYLDSLFLGWKKVYRQQGRTGKILIACFALLAFSFLWVLSVRLFRSSNSSKVLGNEGSGLAPSSSFSAAASATPLLAATHLPESSLTMTRSLLSATQIVKSAVASGLRIVIIGVDKLNEFVDIQNVSNTPVDLRGWRLVSEKGNETCALDGLLQPNERFRIWSTISMDNTGFSCSFPEHIWKNNGPDPAVLYNPDEQEVSRYP